MNLASKDMHRKTCFYKFDGVNVVQDDVSADCWLDECILSMLLDLVKEPDSQVSNQENDQPRQVFGSVLE